MNLSNEINTFIQNFEYQDFKEIKFGEVLNNLSQNYDISKYTEEQCIEALKDMKCHWLSHGYIEKTTSPSTLHYLIKRDAKTIEDMEKIISEEFQIFDISKEVHKVYDHRFEIRYYRNPGYCDERHYIEVTVLTEPDFNTIKKILDVRKGV